ncbi:MAG: IS110 family transposase, partial [Chloroflexota bacterium]|nr:IS110 family transposase [Chloroflexota bacterium]
MQRSWVGVTAPKQYGGVVMDIILRHCAGGDVHKKFVVVCRRWIDEQGRVHKEVRRFSTMTADLEALRDWLVATGCPHIALESTGVYWQPVYNVLEGHVIVWLVNAQHIKQVAGRKTDIKDAEWLAQLLQHGLLRPSFIPERAQRDLRDVVRYRQRTVQDRTRIVNRIQKVLEDANLKLAAVATDLQGVSAQAILRALLAGQDDPHALADLARGKLRTKQAELERALTGHFRPHHRFLLAELLAHLDFLDDKIATVEARIEEALAQVPAPFQEVVTRLDTIPGVDRQVAIVIVAEIGGDLTRFPSDKHLTAWAGLAPGQNETGGKQRASKPRKGNRYLRWALVQAGHGAARKKGAYLKALYYRLAARRGKPRA